MRRNSAFVAVDTETGELLEEVKVPELCIPYP